MKAISFNVSRRKFLRASALGLAALPAARLLGLDDQPEPGAGESARAIILIGPPGAGKSEQSRRMSHRHSLPVISSGNLLRDQVRRGTELGRQADAFMKAGKLVPDSLMNPILEERLSQPDCARGFILDGYPRTLAQAENLDEMLKKRGLPRVVVLLEVPTERVLKQVAGRRVCPLCNRSYNIYFQPPHKEGVCDADGTPLVQRPDDKEDVILRRLETYHQQTQPAIDYYRQHGPLLRINGAQTIEQVAADIETALGAH